MRFILFLLLFLPILLFAQPKEISIVQNFGTHIISIHNLPEVGTIRAYDSMGRTTHLQTITSKLVNLNAAFWPPGIYVIEIQAKNLFFRKKILNN